MTDRNLQAAAEIGKIYASFQDRKLLCDFFADQARDLIKADDGYLFLSSGQDRLWQESSAAGSAAAGEDLKAGVLEIFLKGKPVYEPRRFFIPLLVQNAVIGIAVFLRVAARPEFSSSDRDVATNLTFQLAGALKTILLIEENVKMARLAAIGQTMGFVLHEIKNIIQLATFSQEYLKMGVEKNKKEYLEKGRFGIQKAVREMDGFVYELLSLTKDYRIRPEKFRYQDLLAELHEDLRDRAGQFGVRLEFGAEEGFPEVDGESRSIYRALLNMTKNAMEASGEKDPFIRIDVRSKDAETYQIKIEDNGIVMTDEVKARLFQAFFSTKGEKGTGLGLMIIEKTFKAHNGKIGIESTLGKGTTFTITLPKKITPPH